MALGDGRTLDRALERLAVKLAVLALLALLPGCSLISDFSGIVAAGVTGSATANPAIGIGVGIGVRAGVDDLVKYLQRKRQAAEQDAIAEAAGSIPLGQAQAWEIRHTIPIGNEHGQLAAVREFSTKLTTCREIMFTVEDDPRELYVTTLCRKADRWAWAEAEPAVERWGFLQHTGF